MAGGNCPSSGLRREQRVPAEFPILKNIPPATRAAAADRLQFLRDWDRARARAEVFGGSVAGATLTFIASLKRSERRVVSTKTLYNWRRAYLIDGIAGLVDQRSVRSRETPSRFLKLVKEIYAGPGLLSMEVCHDRATAIADARGWKVCTFRESQRFIRARVLPDLTREKTPSEDRSNGL